MTTPPSSPVIRGFPPSATSCRRAARDPSRRTTFSCPPRSSPNSRPSWWGSSQPPALSPKLVTGSTTSWPRGDDGARAGRPPTGRSHAGSCPGDAGRAHGLSRALGDVALAAGAGADLRRLALRGICPLRLPRHRPALLERGPHDRGLHRRLGGARIGGRTRDRSRARRAAPGTTTRLLAAAAVVGDAGGGDGESLRVALPPGCWSRELSVGERRDQLAR